MANVLITGANRGIGLEMARRFAQAGDKLFAACRQPEKADALASLVGDVTLVQLDVTDEDSVAAAAERISAETVTLDIVINNAGILLRDAPIDRYDVANLNQTFAVNVTGPTLVAKYFVPLLRKGQNARLVNISSQLGSMTYIGNSRSGTPSYNASKAALNMLVRMWAHELRTDRIAVVTIHPGWVQTDMGGASATLTPAESADGLVALINRLTLADTNKFFRWDGSLHDW